MDTFLKCLLLCFSQSNLKKYLQVSVFVLASAGFIFGYSLLP